MADNSIFAKLKKVFSNDVIIRNIGGKKLKVIDTSNLQNSPDSNTLKDRFNRLRATNYGVYSRDMIMSYQSARIELFRDYDVMAMDPILSSALDIYADESTTEDAFGNILTIKSEDENIKEILHNLFYDILNIDFNLWSWVHSMCKYGDAFLKIDISSEYGVFMVHPLSAYEVYRIETVDENNSVTYKFRHEGSRGLGELENYEVAHFRLLSDANFLPYGRSMFEGARRVWKQLCLHENSDIWTNNGYKKIKNIVKGDIVYSYDYEKCKTVKTKVKNCLQTGVKSTYKLKTRSRELILTEDHPVLVKDKNDLYSYKEVKNLNDNDRVVTFDFKFNVEFQKIEEFFLFEENSNVWDIEVESEHHNFVANGIVVHNCLMEDAMLIHRIMRAPEHRIFKIDVGNIPPSEIDAHMEKIISRMKKVPYLDEKTGDYNLRFNLQNMTEDFYLPVRGGDSGTQIDTLPGMEFTGIDDIEYLKNKMLAALKIPKQFLGFDENAGDKSSLAMLDIRFARTITRIQKVIVSELTRIAILHLFVQGYRDASLVNFQLSLTNPSTIFEQEKIQIWSDKVDLAAKFMESKLVSKDWLYEHVFELSDDDVANIKEQLIRDAKEAYRFKEIEENGEDPVANFDKLKTDDDSADGGMGSGGDDFGGGEPTDVGGDSEGAGEEAAPEVPETPEGLTETSKIRLKASTSKETKRKNHNGLGQDLLGKLKNKRVSLRKDADKNRYKNLSLLSLENIFNTNKFAEKKKVLIENSEKLSLLDEKNIL